MKKYLLITSLLFFAISCSTPMRVLYLDIKDDQGNRVKDITMIDAEQDKPYKYKVYHRSGSYEDRQKDTMKFYIPKKEKVELKLYELKWRYNESSTDYLYESQYLTVLPTDTFFQITMKCTDAYLQDQRITKELLQKSRNVTVCVFDERGERAWATIEVLDLPLNFKSETFRGEFDNYFMFQVPLPADYNRLKVSDLGCEDQIISVDDNQYYIEVRLIKKSDESKIK